MNSMKNEKVRKKGQQKTGRIKDGEKPRNMEREETF